MQGFTTQAALLLACMCRCAWLQHQQHVPDCQPSLCCVQQLHQDTVLLLLVDALPGAHPPGKGLFEMMLLRLEPTWLVPSLACQPRLIFHAKGSVASSSACGRNASRVSVGVVCAGRACVLLVAAAVRVLQDEVCQAVVLCSGCMQPAAALTGTLSSHLRMLGLAGHVHRHFGERLLLLS